MLVVRQLRFNISDNKLEIFALLEKVGWILILKHTCVPGFVLEKKTSPINFH